MRKQATTQGPLADLHRSADFSPSGEWSLDTYSGDAPHKAFRIAALVGSAFLAVVAIVQLATLH